MFHFPRTASPSFSGSQTLETDVICREICLGMTILADTPLKGMQKVANHSIL